MHYTCPTCQAPADGEPFVLESTDGPVEHIKVRCVAGHWHMLTTEMLARGE